MGVLNTNHSLYKIIQTWPSVFLVFTLTVFLQLGFGKLVTAVSFFVEVVPPGSVHGSLAITGLSGVRGEGPEGCDQTPTPSSQTPLLFAFRILFHFANCSLGGRIPCLGLNPCSPAHSDTWFCHPGQGINLFVPQFPQPQNGSNE